MEEENNKSSHWFDIQRNLSSTEPTTESEEIKVPTYYVGNTYRKGKYQARYVVEDFECTWNIGNVVTYCLRSKFKHDDGGIECLEKSINHLKLEIERLKKLHNK